MIDVGGEDCIRAEGDCTVTINAGNITLQNCDDGIRTEGSAMVDLSASDNINISAQENGIGLKTCQKSHWTTLAHVQSREVRVPFE